MTLGRKIQDKDVPLELDTIVLAQSGRKESLWIDGSRYRLKALDDEDTIKALREEVARLEREKRRALKSNPTPSETKADPEKGSSASPTKVTKVSEESADLEPELRDGKFSKLVALQQFGWGLLGTVTDPLKAIFNTDSPWKSFGLVVACGAVVAAGFAWAPVGVGLLAFGGAYAVYKLVQGGWGIYNSKGDQKELAFRDLGKGVGVSALTLIGIRGVGGASANGNLIDAPNRVGRFIQSAKICWNEFSEALVSTGVALLKRADPGATLTGWQRISNAAAAWKGVPRVDSAVGASQATPTAAGTTATPAAAGATATPAAAGATATPAAAGATATPAAAGAAATPAAAGATATPAAAGATATPAAAGATATPAAAGATATPAAAGATATPAAAGAAATPAAAGATATPAAAGATATPAAAGATATPAAAGAAATPAAAGATATPAAAGATVTPAAAGVSGLPAGQVVLERLRGARRRHP